ncbi:hypothetical protein E4U03_01335 [Rothia nasimurium]|uniref:Uncharacterized protein n=1 Tax=Rothia nasimurium TaxID=85336 RepID=A0A4Y9F7V6_9MICC|nr:hypothetical protein [Rothia nasimurium]MBF0807263.1 hypothetical protein [Rothia nasimurium]TFU24007.1 hypothetical protein E4U03_01335 [Rothia nasimurium]
MTLKTQRRTIVKAGLWSAPAVLATTAVPAYAASALPEGDTDLAIELAQPLIDWDTFEPVKNVGIYVGKDGTTPQSYGSLPDSMTITNVGTVPAVNPSGILLTQMKDVRTDVNSLASIGTQVNSVNPLVTFAYTGQANPNGPTYAWVYAGTLVPGASVTIPLRYYVEKPFWNVDYELFVAATVIDDNQGDYDDNSELMGTVTGFLAS